MNNESAASLYQDMLNPNIKPGGHVADIYDKWSKNYEKVWKE